MKRSRHTYHYSVRCVKNNKINIQKQRLADSFSDNTNFWKNVSYLNQANKSLPDVVDKASGCKQVSSVFLEKYKTIYTSVPTPDNDMAHITDKISNRISNTDCNINVTPDIINDCIAKLKRGKSDGNVGFNSSHLVHGGRRLRVLLSLLFNAMIVHGHYPTEFLKSTIVSIPKDKTASLSNSDNYRGISMFNSIHKLFDYVIIDICGDSLATSDMQYGYKNNHSTTMCTVILKEVLHHYINGNSNVYCCLLDASKAFDKINYGKLFSTLLQRNVNVYCIRLIVDSYVRQISRVSWGNHLSQYFELSNGVKQGGVLSPILFNIYIDKLLLKLKGSGYGCHIINTFVGALCYADDVTLLSPSIRGLNAMISLCEVFAKNFDITFNCKKTGCIKFGQKRIGNEHVYLNAKKIEWVNQIKHLGNYIDRNLNDNIDCSHKKSIFSYVLILVIYKCPY